MSTSNVASSGSSTGRPLYYGSSSSGHGGPAYYGGGSNAYYYGGGYGGSYGGSSGGEGGDSLIGTITLGRMIRVVGQRWITVLVALLIGLIVAFAVYRISPTIFEATSEFTMEMKRPQASSGLLTQSLDGPDYGSTYEEVFNTRIADWRSDRIINQIIAQYRANYPAATVSDDELLDTLQDSKIELVRRSRLITISVRSKSKELAAALANAYAKAIESFTDDENKLRCDKAVSQITATTEKQGRSVEKAEKALLDFRMANKVDILLSTRETLKQGLTKTTADILGLESDETAAQEWEKVLDSVQKDPENFGALPTSVPRSSEIATAYQALQDCLLAKNALLARYTLNHPEVRAKEKESEIYKQQFVDVVTRALQTARGNLQAIRNQLAQFRAKRDQLNSELAAIEQKIVAAQSGLEQLEGEKDVASTNYKDSLQRLNEARILAEQNNEVVRTGRPAIVPKKPVLPQPLIIFPLGAVLGLAFGLLFVLVLDHLEDTIIGIADIEQRLALKVLAVLPHVRRKKREQVARFVADDKYSQFAEAVAGLRNLLDSPRYQMISHAVLCMSTQPGEGKTITSSSLAISDAQAGKHTLLVDFDLRRPRLAGVWGFRLDVAHSFSHVLTKNDPSTFETLATPSGIENLDVIASLPPDDINPASIMGSQIVSEFFQWARAHYDRVIIDSPPYGIVGDVMTLASMVDSVMILCCPDRTRFKPIQHAARHLTEAGATIIGVVVNDVDMSGSSAFLPTGRSYGYGGYGYRSYSSYGPRPSSVVKTGESAGHVGAAGALHRPGTPAPAIAAKKKLDFADDD